jgi:hypothetical protein
MPFRLDLANRLCLLMKGGYYYRPKMRGYTASMAEAGLYDLAEAEKHVANTEGVSIVRLEKEPKT